MGRISITPLTPSIGAEVRGVDLAAVADGDDGGLDEIRAAFAAHHVLVFREQHLYREQHKALGRRFGQLHVHPTRRRPDFDGDPEIFPVAADADTVLNNGGLWHSDVSCDPIPPLGSMLLLTETPPEGGDTLFANMHLAYETLSEPIRTMLAGLWARHDQAQDLRRYGYRVPAGSSLPASRHPVVVAHPETGRPLLFVNQAFTTEIEGLSERESDALLALLFGHISGSPAIQCRVRWEPGTLTFWDNRCTQHFAVWDYHPQVRRGDRVTIAGTVEPAPAFG